MRKQIKTERSFRRVPAGEMEEQGGKYSWLACCIEVRAVEPWVHALQVERCHPGMRCFISSVNDRCRNTAHPCREPLTS